LLRLGVGEFSVQCWVSTELVRRLILIYLCVYKYLIKNSSP
jgi:hypothetical protein